MRTVRRGERRSGDEDKARLRDCAFHTHARVRLSRPTLSPLLFGPPLPPTRPSPLSIPPPFSLTPRQTVPNRPPASPAAPCPFDPLSAFPSASATRIIRVVRRMRIRTTRIGGFLFQTFSRFPFSSPLFNPVSRFPLLSPFPAPPPLPPLPPPSSAPHPSLLRAMHSPTFTPSRVGVAAWCRALATGLG